MRNTICVKCQEEYIPIKNEVLAVFYVNSKPDGMYFADLWQCPICKSEIIIGFGHSAICYSFEEDWDKYLKNSYYQKIHIDLKRK